MKKLIFGCTLMLCGAVCGTGWAIARTLLVEPGACSSLWSLFFSRDGFPVLFFYGSGLAGAALALLSPVRDSRP